MLNPLKPRDVVTSRLVGTNNSKRRPTVVVSGELNHADRPDVSLKQSTALRAYFGMVLASDVQLIGHPRDRNWQGVRPCLGRALSFP